MQVFQKLEYKTKMLILPVSVVLAIIFFATYASFFKLIKEDYLHKSRQFSEQFMQNASLRLNKIQNISENLIKSYNLDTILDSGASLSNINRCLSNFNLYDPSIDVVILTSPARTYSDGSFTPELIDALSQKTNLDPNDFCWLINPVDSTSVVYARRLSQKSQYLFVSAKIDYSELLPKGDSIFSSYSAAYIMIDEDNIYTIKGEIGDDAKITYASSAGELRFGNELVIKNTMQDYPMTVLTVQSTKYLTSILSVLMTILIFLYIASLVMCYIFTTKTSKVLSFELEKLNYKLAHGTEQIDELTDRLK